LDGSTGDLKESHLLVLTSLQLRRTMRYAYMFILLFVPLYAHATVHLPIAYCTPPLQGASETKPLANPHGAAAEDKKEE